MGGAIIRCPESYVSAFLVIQPPYSIRPNRLQAALTRRFLQPVLAELEAFLLAMRAETDGVLAPRASGYRQKPYPYGYCLEITEDVLKNLRARGAATGGRAERALNAFLAHGGAMEMVWGVLRDRYFQNAIQLGSLYVDVANDTVDLRKPKVEILPMQMSGLELVRDVAHFARIAERYWGVRCYANIALPALAPLYPVLFVDPSLHVLLQSNAGYMTRMLTADAFHKSERWLREAPAPPPEIVMGLRENCPADILAASPVATLDAALEACRSLRSVAKTLDLQWIVGMGEMFDRVPQVRILKSRSRPIAVNHMVRTNARFVTGVDVFQV